MAISVVQTAGVFTAGTVSFSSPVTNGNLVLVCYETFPTPGIITAVDDTHGGIWQSVSGTDNSINGDIGLSIWYNKNVSGAWTGVNITGTGNQYAGCLIEIAGADPTNPIDFGATTAANGQPVTPSFVISNAGDLLTSFNINEGGGVTGIDSGWTKTGPDGFTISYFLPGAPGTFQATYAPVQNFNFVSSGVAVKPPTGVSTKVKASMNLVF
jgi:hypothetical protein